MFWYSNSSTVDEGFSSSLFTVSILFLHFGRWIFGVFWWVIVEALVLPKSCWNWSIKLKRGNILRILSWLIDASSGVGELHVHDFFTRSVSFCWVFFQGYYCVLADWEFDVKNLRVWYGIFSWGADCFDLYYACCWYFLRDWEIWEVYVWMEGIKFGLTWRIFLAFRGNWCSFMNHYIVPIRGAVCGIR